MAETLANNAWAVHILEVALSLLICCSRVYIASLKAEFPLESLDYPIILPGIFLFNSSVEAKNAAEGPPKPIGTPNLWALPTHN